MSRAFDFSFVRTSKPEGGVIVTLKAADGDDVAAHDMVDPESRLARAFKIGKFTGRIASAIDIIAPEGLAADRLIVVGLGKSAELTAYDWMRVGGAVAGKIGTAEAATIYLDVPGLVPDTRQVADFAIGMILRAYDFDRYKTTAKTADDEPKKPRKTAKITLVTGSAVAAKKVFDIQSGLADGVILARELVNEPPNILGTVEFAERAKALESLGVEVEILGQTELEKLGMGALLGVSQGSVRPPQLVIMQWKGGKAKDKPLAFVGKGVVFDSGGISLKPGAGMEDMKGDMGGAAAVTGLMHALASRKAKANVVGILGLVENMPDANAQRPGDIVTSMSGQTIEIVNTDAEGRLVLADALHYCRTRFDPQFMINLATLTGAIGVALGPHHAGLFSNDDTLSDQLLKAGLATREALWRMPLGKEYDKMIDSRFADMKNSGGRQAGSITAAQFLKRYVGTTPWAHLDIASTALASLTDDISTTWASGFGVRLLNALVESFHEA